MSAVTEHAAHEHHKAHDHHVPSDSYFIKVALVLAVFTAVETSTYWWPDAASSFTTPTLLLLMAVKFWVIIRIFMHLKFDSPLFSAMFYIGLGLALFVYIVYLFTFQFFAR